MSLQKRLKKQKERRANRVRNRISSDQKGRAMPRVSVFRSLNHIYAQVIDDQKGNTVTSFSSLQLKEKSGDKKEAAKQVGIELGKRAQAAAIEAIVFDRGSYRYHGRVRALAEGLRESGLKF